MSEFHAMYEGTSGIRLDTIAQGDEGTFPREWIDCYSTGPAAVQLSMSDEEGTMVEHKLTNKNAIALGFGLIRAGLDMSMRNTLDTFYKLVTGEDPRK